METIFNTHLGFSSNAEVILRKCTQGKTAFSVSNKILLTFHHIFYCLLVDKKKKLTQECKAVF